MAEKQTVTAADVGEVPAGIAVSTPQVKVEGKGTFTPPGHSKPVPTPREPNPEREAALAELREARAALDKAVARKLAAEEKVQGLDAAASLSVKLANMTPAELALLQVKMAEHLQKQINAGAEAKAG